VKILGAEDIFVSDNMKPFIKTLVHIFRNSVDHGIESVDERLQNGKDEKATISCITSQDSNYLTLEIIDDGKGIDAQKIKDKALQKAVYPQEKLDIMRDEEMLLIIFDDAFSTKDEATELSGRGIGLGAVKAECEKLGGVVQVQTKLSKGTTFRFVIPNKNI
jgi:two-component system chemotaxis sensor kinase CheA